MPIEQAADITIISSLVTQTPFIIIHRLMRCHLRLALYFLDNLFIVVTAGIVNIRPTRILNRRILTFFQFISNAFTYMHITFMTKRKIVLIWYNFCFTALQHILVFRARSVNLATLFLGEPPRQFTST